MVRADALDHRVEHVRDPARDAGKSHPFVCDLHAEVLLHHRFDRVDDLVHRVRPAVGDPERAALRLFDAFAEQEPLADVVDVGHRAPVLAAAHDRCLAVADHLEEERLAGRLAGAVEPGRPDDDRLDRTARARREDDLFRRLLARPVPHVRVIRGALVEDVVGARVRSDRRVGRHVHQAAHAFAFGGFGHVPRPVDVHLRELLRAMGRVNHRGDVEQRRALRSSAQSGDGFGVADVALDDLDAADRVERARVSAGEHEATDRAVTERRLQPRHVGEAVAEDVDEPRPEPARGTSDDGERAHVRPSMK